MCVVNERYVNIELRRQLSPEDLAESVSVEMRESESEPPEQQAEPVEDEDDEEDDDWLDTVVHQTTPVYVQKSKQGGDKYKRRTITSLPLF